MQVFGRFCVVRWRALEKNARTQLLSLHRKLNKNDVIACANCFEYLTPLHISNCTYEYSDYRKSKPGSIIQQNDFHLSLSLWHRHTHTHILSLSFFYSFSFFLCGWSSYLIQHSATIKQFAQDNPTFSKHYPKQEPRL